MLACAFTLKLPALIADIWPSGHVWLRWAIIAIWATCFIADFFHLTGRSNLWLCIMVNSHIQSIMYRYYNCEVSTLHCQMEKSDYISLWTIMTQSFWTQRSWQKVQIQIRLLLICHSVCIFRTYEGWSKSSFLFLIQTKVRILGESCDFHIEIKYISSNWMLFEKQLWRHSLWYVTSRDIP